MNQRREVEERSLEYPLWAKHCTEDRMATIPFGPLIVWVTSFSKFYR